MRKINRKSLQLPSDEGFIDYSNATKDIPLSKDFFITPVRQRMLYHPSLKGSLYYSNPTKDSLLFLSQRISLLLPSDKGFARLSSILIRENDIMMKRKITKKTRTTQKKYNNRN